MVLYQSYNNNKQYCNIIKQHTYKHENRNNKDFDTGVYHKFAYKENDGPTEDTAVDENTKEKGKETASARSKILKRTLLNADNHGKAKITNAADYDKYTRIDMSVVDKVSKFGYT